MELRKIDKDTLAIIETKTVSKQNLLDRKIMLEKAKIKIQQELDKVNEKLDVLK